MFGLNFGSPGRPPVLLRFRSSKAFIITTVSAAIFTDIFLYGIIVPVLPFALTSRANVDQTNIQTWISIFLALYGAALLLASPFCGWVADRTSSRRWPMVAGLLALGGSTVMLCVGSSIAILAVGRVLQGLSAAVTWVVGLALLVDTVGSEGLGQAMGYAGLSMSLAFLLGPLLGGVVFAASGYYEVFAMAFALIVLDICLRMSMIEKKIAVRWLPSEQEHRPEQPESRAVDIGTLTSEKSVDMTDVEMESARREGGRQISKENDTSRPELERRSSDASAAGEALPAHARSSAKNWREKLPPVVSLLASRRLDSALWACLVASALLTAFDSILPLFVHETFHWNSTGAGIIFLPITVTSFAGPLIGTLVDKYGARWLATTGFVLACPFLILLRLVHEDTLRQKVLLCALLTMFGVTITLVVTPMMTEIGFAVDAKARRRPPGFFGKNGAYAQAYSLFNMSWAAGAMVGPLLGGLIKQKEGWGTATLVLGCLSLFTALPAAVWTGGSIFKKRRQREELQTAAIAGSP